ncbi:translocation and assembly module lipoprotein TamL [Belliella buryatensis]
MNKAKYINFIFLLFLISSCSLTKGLKDNEYLVYQVQVEGVEKSDKDAITNLIKQEPNTRIPLLNTSIGVAFYRFGEWTFDSTVHIQRREKLEKERRALLNKKEEDLSRREIKRFNKINNQITSIEKKLEFGNFFMRTGNPRVIHDSTKTEDSQRQISFYLSNNGFFENEVDYAVAYDGKKAKVKYLLTENQPYIIDSVYSRSDDENIYQLLEKNKRRSEIKPHSRYEQAQLSRERQRVEDFLKENGYYTFSKSYIEYNVYKDTLEKTVQIEQVIRKPATNDFHKVYTLDSIYFSIDAPSGDTFFEDEANSIYKDINFKIYRDRYSEKIISSRIFLNQGDLYNKTDVLETQRQLANLDLFRFVNISFDTLGTVLRPRIFTQPNQKYLITNQLGASITEQVPGPFFSHSLRNRNLFRGAEIFEFNFRAGLEGVVSATGEGGVFRSRELNTSASIIFPQFLVPMNKFALERFGRYNPRTRTLIGYNYVDRPEYNRESVNGILAYNWNTRNLRQQFSLNLVDANFIRSNLSNDFREILEDLQNQGNNLINSFLPSYVSSISGQVIINFNQYGVFQKNSASLLRLFLESGGTTLNFVNREFIENRSLAYFQFLKFQADFRRYIPLGNKQTFAYRLNLGMAKPYGISDGILPYEKYFFAGGSTGIRAWQPRRLGPGSYTPPLNEDGSFDYRFEQPGDILFEGMLEYRRKLYGYFDGAFFIDFGNSWTFLDDPTRQGANFEFNRFYKEIAVGTGLGLRMDFDFLVLRLDMGVKAVDPAREEGQRFILGNFFNGFLGERGQTVFNIGIGYPF